MDERYLIIDSRKRDLAAYPNANNFSVYLMNPIKDIIKVEVVMCIMNLYTNTTIYGLLDIDQFRSKFGISDTKSNLTSNIQTYDTFNMTACIPIQSQLNVIYQEVANYRQTISFQQPIESLNKLSIRWTDRLNNFLIFGPAENQTLLRIYTIRKPAPTEREPELPQPIQKTWRNPEAVLIIVILVLVLILVIF